MKQKSPKLTLLADNTRGLITTKQRSPGQSLVQHRIPSFCEKKEISMKNIGNTGGGGRGPTVEQRGWRKRGSSQRDVAPGERIRPLTSN